MEIIPHRILIDMNADSTFKSALLQYQISDDAGNIGKKFYSIEIDKNAISIPLINDMINKSITHAKTQEKKSYGNHKRQINL